MLALAITLGGVALAVLWSLLTMQYDHLGWDHAIVIRNREMSLIRRSGKYTFLWAIVWDRQIMAVRITEVSLIRRAVIERFHYSSYSQHAAT